MSKIFLTDNELQKFGDISNWSNKAEALLKQQKESWQLLKENYEGLNFIKINTFEFDEFKLKVQFNPARITSTAAKVDNKSISDRKCFLCSENLPGVQKGIKYNNDYIILCNPYPIFAQHLTIPHVKHIPQRIDNSFNELLNLSKDLSGKFFVFYNGPQCGASAPDHLHFQAGLKNTVPIENEFKNIVNKFGKNVISKKHISVYVVNNTIRNFILISSSLKEEISSMFKNVLNKLKKMNSSNDEPLLNILSFYENNIWNVLIFPRAKHRPDQYFLSGEKQILISPASVDIAGLSILPREEDFNKITRDDLIDIYSQVTLNIEKLF